MKKRNQDVWDRLTSKHAGMDAMIAKYGWAVQAVFAGEDSPTFAYTVGLSQKGLPEVIVFGLPQQVAQQFLNDLGRRFTNSGVPPLDTDLDDVADGFPARLVSAPRSEADRYMFATHSRYPNYTALQLVWTDKLRRWPWDSGFEPSLVKQQPVLRNHLH